MNEQNNVLRGSPRDWRVGLAGGAGGGGSGAWGLDSHKKGKGMLHRKFELNLVVAQDVLICKRYHFSFPIGQFRQHSITAFFVSSCPTLNEFLIAKNISILS